MYFKLHVSVGGVGYLANLSWLIVGEQAYLRFYSYNKNKKKLKTFETFDQSAPKLVDNWF